MQKFEIGHSDDNDEVANIDDLLASSDEEEILPEQTNRTRKYVGEGIHGAIMYIVSERSQCNKDMIKRVETWIR